jgi:hypothetical protein
MPWKDVCKRGRPAGGRVRQDDVKRGDPPGDHDAGAPSPGILRFIREVVRATPNPNVPAKPDGFPETCTVQTYPGHQAADVHFEGRAADVFISYQKEDSRVFGDWLFNWCFQNCTVYNIQGVIFGDRQWFSESHGGQVFTRPQHDHYDHVHVELNGDGAARG